MAHASKSLSLFVLLFAAASQAIPGPSKSSEEKCVPSFDPSVTFEISLPIFGCYNYTEVCLGTDAWCSNKEYYKPQGFCDQDSCRAARFGNLTWQYAGEERPGNFETSDGTDVVCGKVSSLHGRLACFRRHRKGKFFLPFSAGALGQQTPRGPKHVKGQKPKGGISYDDERQVGTKAYCEAEARKVVYGSTEVCLGFRQNPPKESPAKLPFMLHNEMKCYGPKDEPCLGTEEYCGRESTRELRRTCLNGRENPRFFTVMDPGCDERGVSPGHEPCVGTRKWCEHTRRIEIYGSADECVHYRKYPAASLPWKANPGTNCQEMTDTCMGTEMLCQFYAENRTACLEQRRTPKFFTERSCCSARPKPLTNQGQGQGQNQTQEQGQGTSTNQGPADSQTPVKEPGIGRECCKGTDEWCHKNYAKLNYDSEGECFKWRGFDYDQMVSIITDKQSKAWKSRIFEKVRVTKNKDFEIVLQRNRTSSAAPATTTVRATKTNVMEALGAMEGRCGEVAKRVMDGVRDRVKELGQLQ